MGPRTGAATVKVSNLHAEATEQDLKVSRCLSFRPHKFLTILQAALSEFGKVIRVSILYNSTGVSTGEAHVVFADRADALKCIRSLDGQMADGRTLKCEEIKTLTIAGAARFEGGKGAAPSRWVVVARDRRMIQGLHGFRRAMASAPGAKPPISQRITKPQGRQSGFRG